MSTTMNPKTLHTSPLLFHFPHSLTLPRVPTLALSSKPTHLSLSIKSSAEIDMVINKQGIYTPKTNKVVVLWDLDNKPPRGPPYPAAMELKKLAQKLGDVIDMCAYANRHAFIHLPQWVVEERKERKRLDVLERKGQYVPSEPYVCGVCGKKCKTNLDLRKHFKQLHEREREKKLNRMRSLKGKKRQRFKERFISGNEKYNEEARRLVRPKSGYGLASELRRAGVYVKTVEDKPQAADWALKRQVEHSMSRGVDWLFLVSDDSDFSETLRKAREANLGTVVVGDRDRALGRHADVWVPWIGVENGEVTEKDLVPRKRSVGWEREEDEWVSLSDLGGCFDDNDSVVDELLSLGSYERGMSAFSEEEYESEDDKDWDYGSEDDEDH